jgi:pimeloyl-ACP methyl ester carboxylesterase
MPRSASVDGFELAYDCLGSGPPVVPLHGWPESRHDDAEVGARLQAETDLIVPDPRGFGDSDRPRPPTGARRGQARGVSTARPPQLACRTVTAVSEVRHGRLNDHEKPPLPREWAPALEVAGTPHRRIYDLRHTFTSHALAARRLDL